jgi:cytochrome b561
VRTHATAPLLALALLLPPPARAEESSTGHPQEVAPAAKVDLSVRPPPGLDLLIDEKAPLPARDPAFEELVQRRRTLLSVHQAVGLATWGLMATTVVVGQLNYNDLYGRDAAYTQKYRETHVALAGATTASFAFTGILALAAPEPYPKRVRLDTATVHKVSMGLTTLGLVSQIALGYLTHNSPNFADQRRLAQAHQALGYATLGTMTIGAVTLVF